MAYKEYTSKRKTRLLRRMEPLRQSLTWRFVRRLFPLAPPAIEIELIAQLFSGSEAAVGIMGIVAGATGIQAALNHDRLSAGLLFSVALVALVRASALRRLRQRYGTKPLDLAAARRRQRRYAIGSFTSSLLIGTTNLSALSYRDPPLALLVICALCSYVFSLILRTAVRPIVCLPSIAITLGLTLAGLPLFLNEGRRLDPIFAAAALATVAVVMVLA